MMLILHLHLLYMFSIYISSVPLDPAWHRFTQTIDSEILYIHLKYPFRLGLNDMPMLEDASFCQPPSCATMIVIITVIGSIGSAEGVAMILNMTVVSILMTNRLIIKISDSAAFAMQTMLQ